MRKIKVYSIVIITLLIILFIQACKKDDIKVKRTIQVANTTESKILNLLPSEYFENGYSQSGFLDGDVELYFTKDALNVVYLINGQQILEKGIPKNIILTENRTGKKNLRVK